ncbi:MAG: HAD-IA family hydrolase, partial [Candidatus Zixiibacteriota bacterium]
TTMSQDSLHKKMTGMGLPIEKHEIISAVQAAVLYLRGVSQRSGVRRPRLTHAKKPTVGRSRPTAQSWAADVSSAPLTCYLVLTDDCKKDFAEFTQTDQNPDYVVIGDLQLPSSISGVRRPRLTQTSLQKTVGRGRPTAQAGWTYPLLNKIFNLLISGSKLIALHKGKFWQTDQGLTVDIGLFVAGLEYVTGQTATVIGKPSKTFFELALRDLGVKASKAAMIGDDLDNDIAGAQAAGLKAILVKTGKYREELVRKSKVKADFVIDSISVFERD